MYLLGIYEYGAAQTGLDNDANSEFAGMGWTNITANEPNDTSFIAMEIIADVADQWGWDANERTAIQQILALHESGHQFELAHPMDNDQIYPGHIMTHPFNNASEAQAPQVQLVFSEEDILKIRHISESAGP